LRHCLFYGGLWVCNQDLVLTSLSLDDTFDIGLTISRQLEAGVVLLLEGNLGSGKTAFVKALAVGIGVKVVVTSPTFTLIDEYHCGRLPLYHLDLYRLSTLEVKQLHLEEYWQGVDFPLGVVAIEWAERMEVLPETYLRLNFSCEQGGDRRKITVIAKGKQYSRILSNQKILDFSYRD
jgi:tRNA threonylcarbamoyladenosine biosynthesis protein TsaE